MRPSTYSNEEIIAAGNELLKAKTNITGYSLSIQLAARRWQTRPTYKSLVGPLN